VYAFLAALFHQIELDSTSPEPRHRTDVQRFLRDGGLQWWDDLLGLDGVFEQQMRLRRAVRLAQHRQRESHQLAVPFRDG
jgi:hypothetical protein